MKRENLKKLYSDKKIRNIIFDYYSKSLVKFYNININKLVKYLRNNISKFDKILITDIIYDKGIYKIEIQRI